MKRNRVSAFRMHLERRSIFATVAWNNIAPTDVASKKLQREQILVACLALKADHISFVELANTLALFTELFLARSVFTHVKHIFGECVACLSFSICTLKIRRISLLKSLHR